MPQKLGVLFYQVHSCCISRTIRIQEILSLNESNTCINVFHNTTRFCSSQSNSATCLMSICCVLCARKNYIRKFHLQHYEQLWSSYLDKSPRIVMMCSFSMFMMILSSSISRSAFLLILVLSSSSFWLDHIFTCPIENSSGDILQSFVEGFCLGW